MGEEVPCSFYAALAAEYNTTAERTEESEGMKCEARNVAFLSKDSLESLMTKRTAKGAKIKQIGATEGAERSSAVSSANKLMPPNRVALIYFCER